MSTTRTKLLKCYLHPAEEEVILKACAAAGVTRSDQARVAMLHWASRQSHDKRPPIRREGPSALARRAQLLPCRPSYGVVPKMRMRV